MALSYAAFDAERPQCQSFLHHPVLFRLHPCSGLGLTRGTRRGFAAFCPLSVDLIRRLSMTDPAELPRGNVLVLAPYPLPGTRTKLG